jgi:hypothetical protein
MVKLARFFDFFPMPSFELIIVPISETEPDIVPPFAVLSPVPLDS